VASIVIVDDSKSNREYLVTLLGYYGHKLLEASDGEIALKLIESEKLDLVITDIMMPKMGGFELVQKMHSDPLLAGIPVIFYTGAYRVGDADLLAINCGVKYVLSKPSPSQLIVDTVNKALNDLK
jgi:CheY-like chemotaxis protein